MYETFIPGEWKDNIDVNDFIKLNKIPFFETFKFTADDLDFTKYKNAIKKYIEHQKVISIVSEKLLPLKEIISILDNLDLTKEDINKYQGQTFKDVFEFSTSTSIRNGIRMGLLDEGFGDKIPPLFFPDIRQVVLYGMDRIIREKKSYLKRSENKFQTNDWIDKRININLQVGLLNDLSKKVNNKYKNRAESSISAANIMIEIILHSIAENPMITFHLPSLIDFLDIYIEKDIQLGKLSETDSNDLVAEFYTKLIFIHQYLKLKGINFIVTETIFSMEPTKTTFRFLHFYKALSEFQFPLSIVTNSPLSPCLKEIFDDLVSNSFEVTFYDVKHFDRQRPYSISHLGFTFKSSEDVILYNKPCNLMKLFYIALNGGKDIKTNYNLYPVYMKFKGDEIEYDEFIEHIKDVIVQVLTLYSKANNMVMYVSERYFQHTFRSSLKNYYEYYFYCLNFTQIDSFARKLLAIKNKSYSLKRNDKGFVKEFNITEELTNRGISEMIELVTMMIKSEVDKLLFYKLGKPEVTFYIDNALKDGLDFNYTLPETNSIQDVYFTVTNNVKLQSFDDVLKLFRQNITRVNL